MNYTMEDGRNVAKELGLALSDDEIMNQIGQIKRFDEGKTVRSMIPAFMYKLTTGRSPEERLNDVFPNAYRELNNK